MSLKENLAVTVPVELIQPAFKERYVPALSIFIAGKLLSPGRFQLRDSYFQSICESVKLKERTVKKHLNILRSKGWVGFDPENKVYYFRSWTWLREQKVFTKRLTVSVTRKDLPNLKSLLLSAQINTKIQAQKFYNRGLVSAGKLKQRELDLNQKSAVKLKGIASQDFLIDQFNSENGLPYYGISNGRLGRELNLSVTRISELKIIAVKNGYLKSNHFFQRLYEVNGRDKQLVVQYKKSFQDVTSNLHVRYLTENKRAEDGTFSIEAQKGLKTVICRQLHDELIPQFTLKKVNFLKKLKRKSIQQLPLKHAA
jgi:hypothetical protein